MNGNPVIEGKASSGKISTTGDFEGATIKLTGGQVVFPATAVPSADAKTLDDYEEGLWIPELKGSTADPTLTGTTMVGYYTKIGRQVTLTFALSFECTAAGTGYLYISGFPFAVGTGGGGGFLYLTRKITGLTSMVGVYPYGTELTFYRLRAANDDFDAAISAADLAVSTGGIIRGTATYFTD